MSGNLKNQVYLYSIDTSNFYNKEEEYISQKYFKALNISKRIREKKQVFLLKIEQNEENNDKNRQKVKLFENQLKRLNLIINKFKTELNEKLIHNKSLRELSHDKLLPNKAVTLFESTLTRSMKLDKSGITDKLFIVNVFHYPVMESLMVNGFEYEGRRYQYYTSSAGQIRKKKLVFIESAAYELVKDKMTCGMSEEEINSKGGMNSNKYQAYKALTNSASMTWKRFNIDRCIVVDDFSTVIHGEVDYINRDTYEITRTTKDMEIEHMDGCGIMLPTVSKKSFMFRMPWFKGLLASFDFKQFALEKGQTKVTDIYGKEWDIVDDRINVIFTKSQFKLWKYYDSWEDYKTRFKKFRCEACKLNVEDIGADANLNYQMLQTLTTMTDDELKELASDTIQDILNIGVDKKTMLRVLGATKENTNKNSLQKALLFYPELLNDNHTKEIIKDKKKSLVRDAKAGKLRVNGKYTYIIPDLYAFCEWLFLGDAVPKGLLKDQEVHCKLFEDGEELDVLRSPHLYREHAIRNNTYSEEINKWFIGNGIYVSTYDLISRILQFDNDGDQSLVTNNKTLIEVAKREMEGIVPLFYDMESAPSEELSNKRMYKCLTSAYKANIGIISNDITKIWNSEEPSLNAVKWLTMYSNFTIDYAKTLFLPVPPKSAEEEIKTYTKNKLPHFFKYAKDKEEHQVEPLNDSTVNRLEHLIPNKRINFKKASGGNVDVTVLLNNEVKFEVDDLVIDTYNKLNYQKFKWIKEVNGRSEDLFNKDLRDKLLQLQPDVQILVNQLVTYSYKENARFKNSLWNVFGEEIYNNIIRNIGNTIQCENCSKRVEVDSENTKYCEICAKDIKKKQDKLAIKKFRSKKS